MSHWKFISVDTDGDGDTTELKLFKYQNVHGGNIMTTQLDTDRDNKVDASEWFIFTGSFISVDTDADKKISEVELIKYQIVYGEKINITLINSRYYNIADTIDLSISNKRTLFELNNNNINGVVY